MEPIGPEEQKGQFSRSNNPLSGSMDYSTRKLAKQGFTSFGDCLTLKIGFFVRRDHQAPYLRS
ncbi:hypothetical protein H5410_056539 [Solanum commersonii]|uniref:Uncharacterized protein n=1 Tax=Solanum commersonii TaxID=4109 RepID=A0A9J5WM06_SOLCO|nr:hypothetical protein H5410_056539 [Solanum commersonii]